MNSSRNQILLYAVVCGNDGPGPSLDQFSAGHPVERRLNRIERVVAAYRGTIEQRFENAVLVSFPSADAAFLGACEMQHRCAVLPQLSGHPFLLRIGIHQGNLHQRAQDKAIDNGEIAKQMAVLDEAIFVSDSLATSLNPELRQMTRPISLTTATGQPVHQVDWRREIPMSAHHMESSLPSEGFSQPLSRGPCLQLQFGIKRIILNADNPMLTVGRDPQSDLVMADDRISRQHCRIERTATEIFLIDESTNGTCVMTEDGREYFVRKKRFPLKGRGLLFFGRTVNGERRGGVRFEAVHV